MTRLGLNYVPQLANVFPSLSIAENLSIGASALPRPERRSAVDELYERFPALAERLGGGPTLYGLLLSSVAAGVAGVSPQGVVTSSSPGVTIIVARFGNTFTIPALVLVR